MGWRGGGREEIRGSGVHIIFSDLLSQDWEENYRREGKHSSLCTFLTREGNGVIMGDTQRCDLGKTYVPILPCDSKGLRSMENLILEVEKQKQMN